MSLKIKILISIALLMTITLVTWAINTNVIAFFSVKPSTTTNEEPIEKKAYDPALLRKLTEISKNMDGNQNEYSISGMISMINYADSSDVMRNVACTFSKRGNEFYYKLGDTETFNMQDQYVYIDHQARKVLLGPQKKVTANPVIMDISKIIESLQSEEYELLGKVTGKNKTISFLNNHHISCKEYSITFDTLSMKASRIFTRLTNLDDPLRKDNEKIIDLRINQFKDVSGVDQYISASPLKRKGEAWVLTEKYQEYELIEM